MGSTSNDVILRSSEPFPPSNPQSWALLPINTQQNLCLWFGEETTSTTPSPAPSPLPALSLCLSLSLQLSPDSVPNTMDMESNKVTDTIKFLCSYGGKILPRYTDGELRYVGGLTRVLSVDRSISYTGSCYVASCTRFLRFRSCEFVRSMWI